MGATKIGVRSDAPACFFIFFVQLKYCWFHKKKKKTYAAEVPRDFWEGRIPWAKWVQAQDVYERADDALNLSTLVPPALFCSADSSHPKTSLEPLQRREYWWVLMHNYIIQCMRMRLGDSEESSTFFLRVCVAFMRAGHLFTVKPVHAFTSLTD